MTDTKLYKCIRRV